MAKSLLVTTVMVALGLIDVAAIRQTPARPSGNDQTRSTFRSTVDIVAVDVQVVDSDGRPFRGLAASQFSVRIGGRTRRVLSADLVSYRPPDVGAASPAGMALAAGSPPTREVAAGPPPASRMFVIAIDALSFDVRASRAVAIAAQQFIDRLPQDDKVGIFTFPLGPKLVPTTDRPATSRALAAVLGQRGLTSSAYTIRFSELVDMALERVGNAPGEVTNEVISRECEGNNVFATPAPRRTGLLVSDSSCATAVIQEAAARVQAYEAQAMASLGMLRNLFVSLALVPGRKVVVLASAGMPISDRLGGRPDVGNLPTQVGIEAARANAVLNTMFIDSTFIEMFSAEASSGLAASKDLTRDTSVANRGLEQLSGKTGGLFMKILNSNPETAFNRILREMSAYYLLGVEPDPADRDGHPREIKVSVNQRGATVRARNFVIIPKARPD